jgi:hypothetical protein
MQKYISKNTQRNRADYKLPKNKAINRFQQNASRLEHSNVRNKNKGKKN